MGYDIQQMIIPGLPKKPYRHGAGAYEGVVAHATDTPGADALREAKYFQGNWEEAKAFVHFFVDWERIVQTADIDYTAWHAGPYANQRFVGVELCETDDPQKFRESYKRYVWLLAWILYRKRLGVSRKGTLWTHHDVTDTLGGTTHEDPDAYLAKWGVSINQLVADVKAAYDEMASGTYTPIDRNKYDNVKFTRVLKLAKPYMKGDDVKRLQLRLELDKAYGVQAIDGVFGPKTDQAVRNWEAAHHLKVDGVVDQELWYLLFPGDVPQEPKQVEAEKGTYYRVIAGSFQNKANAEAMVKQLEKAGFKPFIDIYKVKATR